MGKSITSKYRNKIIETDDGKFDSQKEYHWWCVLKRKQELGQISNLQRQVKFVLIPSQYADIEVGGKAKVKMLEKECSYIADFVYTDSRTGETIVADTKSKITESNSTFIIKRKLMLLIYETKITILK